MWLIFFGSLVIYLVIASLVRPKKFNTSNKETQWDNRMVFGLMLLIILWIIGAITYNVQHPICQRAGVTCSNVQDSNQADAVDTDYCDEHLCE